MMKEIIHKVKILAMSFVIWFIGCTSYYYIKYNSDVGLDMPIEEKVKITVKGGTFKYGEVIYIPDSAIVMDLRKNVFSNVVKKDYDALCIVEVTN